ncbi:Uncharacterized membrane protein [Paracoccus aminovorans]|uniref:Uncharacterized membrane protein n=1 Tax=Paracoccus aminovorans TaxID=34004 RepID=A0A1I2YGL1_9RHOB|nr:DUF2244 domain-containing protein [Paracoccus aminovorans]CQR86644.1 hypothetical protein JCM7685_2085 [Paracoccus aminovorans]SFH24196.1 Uncharacterized membrane protein [Paracoccus aminovorans]
MPYAWQDMAPEESGAFSYRLELWPHRSLSARGFAWVIGLTALGLALPLLAVVGSTVLWGLLPFAMLVIWALWQAIRRSYGRPHEVMWLSRDRLELRRSDPGRQDRIWRTNPYWVRVGLRSGGPVEDYLVLTDGRREVELGAFLAPEERVALRDELERRLAALRR